jgi:predicted MFS family arabinose efflux permease
MRPSTKITHMKCPGILQKLAPLAYVIILIIIVIYAAYVVFNYITPTAMAKSNAEPVTCTVLFYTKPNESHQHEGTLK